MRISDWSSDVCSSDLADLVGRTGQSLTEIVTAIKKVSDIVAEIAAASREQATGLDQVNTAVGSMDEMTQRDRKSVVEGKSVSVRVDLGGRRRIKKKKSDRYYGNLRQSTN